MREDYSNDPSKRDRPKESLVHIEVQGKIEKLLRDEPEADVSSPDFLRWIHAEFYRKLPDGLRGIGGADGERENAEKEFVEAGRFRERNVAVGHHLPPVHESIDAFMHLFAEYYNTERHYGLRKIVAIAAAHHRLMWIHPFLDGNGRVARLYTDASFNRIGLSGYGLWNVSRGFARRNRDYKQHLDAADFAREGDLDGRGNLSNRTLTEFCRFFLEICIDQATYMASILSLSELLPRIEGYAAMRNQGQIVDEKGRKAAPLHPKASAILREAAIFGAVARAKVVEIVGMSERSSRLVTKSLLDEGLLVGSSDWHRSDLRLGFPPHAAGYWFPNLFPDASARS